MATSIRQVHSQPQGLASHSESIDDQITTDDKTLRQMDGSFAPSFPGDVTWTGVLVRIPVPLVLAVVTLIHHRF